MWNFIHENHEQIDILIKVLAFVVTIASLWWARKQWRLSYLTKEWSALIKHLEGNAKFMDKEKAEDYKNSFHGDDAVRYEMVARLCIGYVDDMFNLGYGGELSKWFRGSVNLLVGTHNKWFRDNKDSYDPEFVVFIERSLG